MRIVDQARLGFQEGNSDKVYEVDLVEVATAEYVVNFRFGRRGTALRDGTKTKLPVSLEKARAVFTALIAEKTASGYKPLTASDVPSAARTAVRPSMRSAERTRELIAQLAQGHRAKEPLHLIVRKVGEQGLSEAEPFLLELLASGSPESKSKPEALRHFVIAALARCGSARSLAPLRAISNDDRQPRHLRDVALLATCMLGGAEARVEARRRAAGALEAAPGQDSSARAKAVEEFLARDARGAHAAIVALYASTRAVPDHLDETELSARAMVLSAARVARLRGIELGLIRTLHWSAEITRDAELFAILARRFESERSVARDTANYFRRRAARVLRRLGNIASPEYVRFARALLLTYRDSDAELVLRNATATWDEFAAYHALNFVLYGESSRYQRAGHRRATWRCRRGYAPGAPPPPAREESFPELWDRAPEALWELGVSEAAAPVIHFATRALRDHTQFLNELDDATLADALTRARRPMRELALETARRRGVNLVLARAALAAELPDADDWVLAWVETTPNVFASQIELLALLLSAKSVRVRASVPRLTRGLTLTEPLARDLVAASVAILMELPDEPLGNDRAHNISAFLLDRVADVLDTLGIEVIEELAKHPLAGVAELGAELLARRARRGALADHLLTALLASAHASVRAIGARIVAETPPSLIKDEPELILHLALSENAELRAGTRNLLGQIASLYPGAGRLLAAELLDALLSKQPEGVPAHVVSLLRHELSACLPRRDVSSVLTLIGALSPHAREAGGLLLPGLGADDLELDQIVRLASHEILLVRQGAWALARAAAARFRVAPVALARLCDARWEDSQGFAFEFVRSFPADVLVPDTVIAICDSIEPAVQRFGQTLLSEYWRDEHATRYLLRLSEHPATNIQLLVSGLLDRYARGNPTLLEQLLPCFATVLSQVNRGAVAKERVLAFLRSEATASPEAAALLAPLLERQSLTCAVTHKAPLIATMVALREHYPEVPLPIETRDAPLHSRGNRGI
jgi:hypothetical protein